MKRALLILLLLVFVSSLSATRVWILPSKDGEISKVAGKAVEKVIPERKAAPRAKGALLWLLNTDGGTPNYYLSGVEDTDTFLNWFQPATDCSLLAYYITNSVFLAGATNDLFTMFMAELDQGIDYVNDYDEYHGTGDSPGPNPVVSIYQDLDTFCYGFDSIWTEVYDTLVTPVDNGTDIFGVGWEEVRLDSSPNPYIYANGNPPYHTLMHREGEDALGWYNSWHCCRMMALVNYYNNPPPVIALENLPDSYEAGTRTVMAYVTDFGVPPDSSGTMEVNLKYQVNGGTVNDLYGTLVSGDSADGYWSIDIPGASAGDTVDYWVIGTDYQGVADTTLSYSYIVRAGMAGHFLWVEDDYTTIAYQRIIDIYSDIMDYWDYGAYGVPDSATIAFYANGMDDTSRTIIWKGWGESALGNGIDYGAGIYYSDTSYIKMLLDNGGNFFLADQDFGAGCGLTPNYGQASVPAGHWVREYLGAQGLYDDNPLLAGTDFDAFSADAIFTDLFSGIGYQTAGQIHIAPYGWTGGMGYAYTCVYDSVMPTATISMFDLNGLTVAYRYDGGTTHSGKVANFGFPFEYVSHPDTLDLIDEVAVDTLVEDVLDWFGIRSGISDRTIEPANVIKLLPVGTVTGEAIIRFTLPDRMPVSLSIYDNTGRLVKNLVNGTRNAGLNTVRWNANVSNGVYFYYLKAGDNSVSDKMVIVR